jgi:hypothetical protein
MHTGMHALSGIRAHDPSVLASEVSSCLRPRSHCDRLYTIHNEPFISPYINCAVAVASTNEIIKCLPSLLL